MSERLYGAALVWFVLLIYKGLRGLKKKSAYTPLSFFFITNFTSLVFSVFLTVFAYHAPTFIFYI